jgi:hypothetical protein
VSYAVEQEIDLICIGAHGKGFQFNNSLRIKRRPCIERVTMSGFSSTLFTTRRGLQRQDENWEEKEVTKKFYQILKARRRRQALVNIRREFEKAGYPLNQFGDSQLEAALTLWTDDIAAVTLNAKAIYRALRRLHGGPAGNRKAGLRRDVPVLGR